ncbi:hypothetical protein [Actinomadura madurae]|uniref:hypothetical protein n=1 Tax=Actinomadura madurae TaxID=1993 RepID=UPI0020D1FE57|nr:hypothetical protein [Actinomadura madurae]MCQ0016310.1 hypothetical protein [Actinomadura madurae]
MPYKAWIIGYNLGGTLGLYWNGTAWSQAAYPLVGFPTAVSAAPDGTASTCTTTVPPGRP